MVTAISKEKFFQTGFLLQTKSFFMGPCVCRGVKGIINQLPNYFPLKKGDKATKT